MIDFLVSKYADEYSILQVGTGDSPLTVPFYEKCGFVRSHNIPNFFTDNYDHPIYECGVQFNRYGIFAKMFITSSFETENRNFYKELIQKAGAETELVYMKASKELLQKDYIKESGLKCQFAVCDNR